MYFILYLIREAVNLPMPFLILLSSLPLTEKNGKSNLFILKSASNLNGNLNCSKELEHYAS